MDEIRKTITTASKPWHCEACGCVIDKGTKLIILTGGIFFHAGCEPENLNCKTFNDYDFYETQIKPA